VRVVVVVVVVMVLGMHDGEPNSGQPWEVTVLAAVHLQEAQQALLPRCGGDVRQSWFPCGVCV
jgi:hypothetical protein